MRPSDADFTQTGLKVALVIRLNKLVTIEQNLVTRRIGRLTTARLQMLDDKLTVAIGIDMNRYHIKERQRLLQLFTKLGIDELIKELRR